MATGHDTGSGRTPATAEFDTDVAVIGAGPAGLVVANLLTAAGVRCVVLERRSRAQVETRSRAGFLAPNTVRVLREHGLAAGLDAAGLRHNRAVFRDETGEFELDYATLGIGDGHTVYPQQLLVRDLMDCLLARGGEIWFDAAVDSLTGLDGSAPVVQWTSTDWASGGTVRARYVAGCDGRLGAARQAVTQPSTGIRVHRRGGDVQWLAVLVAAPQSVPAEVFAIHERGFAGQMARTCDLTRYYLQCSPTEDATSWDDDEVWAELERRMYCGRHGRLRRGAIIERTVVTMGSEVVEPIQHGALFLAGDAASLVNPTAAKGANLAVAEADVLARALIAALRSGDDHDLRHYSDRCLPQIWRAHEFSELMSGLLHGRPDHDGDPGYRRALQRSRLAALRGRADHRRAFATDYVSV